MPTIAQVNQTDPVLTSFSELFRNEQNTFVADRVWPGVNVEAQSGTYYTYTQAYWLTDEMERRAPGNPYPESDYALGTGSYNVELWALAHRIADEERANADAPLNLDQEAAEWLEQKRMIRFERAFASAFMKAGIWGTDDTPTDWDDGGTPISDVQTAKRTIRNATGKPGNSIVMGEIVYDALKTNSQITDLIKYTQSALPGDLEGILAAALDLENVFVSRASYDSAVEGATSAPTPIMDDDALVFYRPPSAPTLKTASAGLLLLWPGGGGMGLMSRVRDELADADVAREKAAFTFKQLSADLGYFFSDIV